MARGPSLGSAVALASAALAALVLVVWLAERPSPNRSRTGPTHLPAATAPPDEGVAPPAVRLLEANTRDLTVAERPQTQLTGWAEAMSTELNIPRAALEAYGYAARATEVSRPECNLNWPVLAGVGAVESGHGRFGGAELDETARPSIPIRGIPLDGADGVRRIDDTDSGRLDGDEVFDRAVGPLQFIPETWNEWAVDADGDGFADPDDLDDAALAAAHYLCDSAGDLEDPDSFWDGVLTYNASRSYVQEVLDFADHYGKSSRSLQPEN
ncbi:lytic murein transglycosylase [Allosaccharopolyspora coralli]|nr:lytic murein transglycosylase [Allosaccharopolyspora coralli]